MVSWYSVSFNIFYRVLCKKPFGQVQRSIAQETFFVCKDRTFGLALQNFLPIQVQVNTFHDRRIL